MVTHFTGVKDSRDQLIKDKPYNSFRSAKGVLFLVLIILSVFLVQSAFRIGEIRLNLSILIVYYFGLKRGATAGAAAGLPVGVIEDILTGHIIGPGMLGKGVTGILSSFPARSMLIWSPLLGAASLFILTVIDEVILYLSVSFFYSTPAPFYNFMSMALIKASVNAPFGLIIRPGNNDPAM